jgi:hypothetical protein
MHHVIRTRTPREENGTTLSLVVVMLNLDCQFDWIEISKFTRRLVKLYLCVCLWGHRSEPFSGIRSFYTLVTTPVDKYVLLFQICLHVWLLDDFLTSNLIPHIRHIPSLFFQIKPCFSDYCDAGDWTLKLSEQRLLSTSISLTKSWFSGWTKSTLDMSNCPALQPTMECTPLLRKLGSKLDFYSSEFPLLEP